MHYSELRPQVDGCCGCWLLAFVACAVFFFFFFFGGGCYVKKGKASMCM